MNKQPEAHSIAVLGGGTGTSNLLTELKQYPFADIHAVVNMSDDGGSSGVLRREYDVLPPGDVRQCLTALSNEPELAELMGMRLKSGHTPGNLLLAEMERTHSSFLPGLALMSKLLDISGAVHPVTLQRHTLALSDGAEIVRGEYTIAHRNHQTEKPAVWLDPAAQINPYASKSIQDSDSIVIAPGNFYGSILPVLAVEGVQHSIQAADTPVTLVTNISNQPGQTGNWHVMDYVEMAESYIGRNLVSTVIYNNAPHSANDVDYSARKFRKSLHAIGAPLVKARVLPLAEEHNDRLIQRPRSKERHNARLLASLLMKAA